MKYAIGVDFGASVIKAVLVRGSRVVRCAERATEARKGKKKAIENILKIIESISSSIPKKDISGVGIGVPGYLDRRRSVILNLPNMPGWKNMPFKRVMQERLGKRVFLENDARCAALAEKTLGAGRGAENFVVVTIGTGIGGGLVINGELYKGSSNAGEIGHMKISPGGLRCSCGSEGCLESLASGSAIKKKAKAVLGKDMDCAELARLSAEDPRARGVFEEAGRCLGIGLANIVNMLNPEAIVIYGGLTGSGFLLGSAKREMKRHALFRCRVMRGRIRHAGALGAALLAKNPGGA
jgi:glucokinase